MARITKQNGRKPVEIGEIPSIAVKYENTERQTGLRFEVRIGNHTVSFTHFERDIIVAKWAELEKNWEQ